MKNPLVAIVLPGLCLLLVSFAEISTNKTARLPKVPIDANQFITPKSSTLYERLCLEEKGLSREAFDYAYKGYRLLINRKLVTNARYLTICDFSQSCRNKRLYVIDIINQYLVMHTFVAHGIQSGMEYATRFSNKLSSHQSSLGFYSTDKMYRGEHGTSLRMTGLEPGFNDNAYRRAIVVHGATYIGNEGMFTGSLMGRSYGCPAVPKKDAAPLINTIKGGTCFFIYHPSRNYLDRSTILND